MHCTSHTGSSCEPASLGSGPPFRFPWLSPRKVPPNTFEEVVVAAGGGGGVSAERETGGTKEFGGKIVVGEMGAVGKVGMRVEEEGVVGVGMGVVWVGVGKVGKVGKVGGGLVAEGVVTGGGFVTVGNGMGV